MPWSSRHLPRPSSNSVLYPLSPESPHDTTIPISLTRRLSPPAAVVRPSCPQTSSPFPTSPQTSAPTPRKLQPNQSGRPACSSTTSSRSLSHHPNIIQFASMPPHGRLPSNSCIGRAPHDFPNYLPTYFRAHRDGPLRRVVNTYLDKKNHYIRIIHPIA